MFRPDNEAVLSLILRLADANDRAGWWSKYGSRVRKVHGVLNVIAVFSAVVQCTLFDWVGV